MLCCAAAAFVIGLARALWHLLPGTGRAQEPGFAPVARRSAPGSPATTTPAPRPGRAPATSLPSILTGAAIGTFLYGGLTYCLLWTGLLSPAVPGPATWAVRDILLAVTIGAALLLASRVAHPAGGWGRSAPAWAVGIGAAWWCLGIVDMHVLSLFQLAGNPLTGDLVFHGTGFVVAAAGAWRLLAARGEARTHPHRTTGAAHAA